MAFVVSLLNLLLCSIIVGKHGLRMFYKRFKINLALSVLVFLKRSVLLEFTSNVPFVVNFFFFFSSYTAWA